MTAEIFLKQVVFEEKRKVTASWALHILSCSPPAGGSPCTRWSLRGARAVGVDADARWAAAGIPRQQTWLRGGALFLLGLATGRRGGEGMAPCKDQRLR